MYGRLQPPDYTRKEVAPYNGYRRDASKQNLAERMDASKLKT
jgi:hypothetical protein